MTVFFGGDGPDNFVGGDAADTMYGEAGNDTLIGGAGDDYLEGGAGADHLDGGAGIDTVNYTGNSGVYVNMGNTDGIGDGLWGDADRDVLINIENVLGTNGYDDVLIGSPADNMLAGYGGNDQLIGADGNDTLLGGNGDDLLEPGAGVDHIDGGDGNDTIDYHANQSYMFIDLSTGARSGGDADGDTFVSIENIMGGGGGNALYGDAGANILTGGFVDDALYGQGGNDTLSGGDGDDLLDGGAGADVLDGGDGYSDTVSYLYSTAGVTVDIGADTAHGGDAEGDTLAGFESIVGSRFDDVLTGNDIYANTLSGGDGNDVLHGGIYDHLDGGAGIDTASYDTRTEGVTVDLVAGTASGGMAQFEILVSIENVTGSQANDTLLGSSAVNTLIGGNGDDVLRGAGGADHLDGGAGFDTAVYSESAVGVTISLTTGTGSGGNAQGDTLVNIEGVIGGTGNDLLIGSSRADTLSGNYGNDVIRGDGGHDTLSGGGGADRFVYDNLGDSPANVNADRITDFSHAQGDTIDLHLIDADSTVAGDQAFHFIGSAAFSHHAGELHESISGGSTTVTADVNGDGIADFSLSLSGSITLQAGDFVL